MSGLPNDLTTIRPCLYHRHNKRCPDTYAVKKYFNGRNREWTFKTLEEAEAWLTELENRPKQKKPEPEKPTELQVRHWGWV